MNSSEGGTLSAPTLRAFFELLLRDPNAAQATPPRGGTMVRARARQVVFDQADPSDAVYVLISGLARAFVASGEDHEAQRNTLLLRGPAVFGDRDLLVQSPSCETVQCLTPCWLLRLDSEDFLSEWGSDVRLRDWLTRDLARRYASTLELERTRFAKLSERVATLRCDAGLRDQLERSTELFAMLVNASPATLARMNLEPDGPQTGRSLFHSIVVPEEA